MAKIDLRKNGVPYVVIELEGDEAKQLFEKLKAIGKTPRKPRPPKPLPPTSTNGPAAE